MPAKRFRVLLEKAEQSEATGIQIPSDVQKAYGTRARRLEKVITELASGKKPR